MGLNYFQKWLIVLPLFFPVTLLAQSVVDPGLNPDQGQFKSDEEVSPVYKNMGVVQRKAMNKSGKFLFQPSMGLEFSDGPYSTYPINTDIGYAFSDFFEVYLQASPFFVTSKRSLIQQVEQLTLLNGDQATIVQVLPKYQFGLQLLWAPLYGKDSVGISSVLRSDTFFKFGASYIKYAGTDSGLRFQLGFGKTFFFSKWLGLRFSISANMTQTIIDSQKKFTPQTLVELGPVFYLF